MFLSSVVFFFLAKIAIIYISNIKRTLKSVIDIERQKSFFLEKTVPNVCIFKIKPYLCIAFEKEHFYRGVL